MRCWPRGQGRSVDRGVGGPGIEPRKSVDPGCRRCPCSGRQYGGVRYRQCPAGPAWSETLARRRNLLFGNREISCSASAGTALARTGKAGGPKPVMHGHEKSDPSIVAMKLANEGGQPPEELVEQRGGAKGNAVEHGTHRTPSRESVLSGLDRIRKAARERKQERFTALLHHIDVDLLRSAYGWLRKAASAGVDGVTWEEYGAGLEHKLVDLHARIHRGAYRAQPSRRVYIPKPDGRQRPLGIAALEDKACPRA